ncbi:hypothetical protein P8452_22581 [Trifolium repens]|nr:hypothetical protein P8452_22581 [Trifolium repens]
MQMSRTKCGNCSQRITQLQQFFLRQPFTSSSSPPLHNSSSTLLSTPHPKSTLPSFLNSSPIFFPTATRIGASRFFSSKPPNIGFNAKKVLEKPTAALTSAFSRYREAMVLQLEAFFKRNQLFLFGAAGVVFCAVLWRILFGIANTFVVLSEGMAKYGFLALSSAIVAFTGLYIRSRFTINPDKVYRMAMTRLNTSAQILEVMGAPLTGTDLRAYVMSGGGLTLKKIKPSIRSRRCFLIFPIKGSERKGLVNVEVKKKQGKYDLKLLAVDVPMASGPDQRLYLIGNEEEYRVGGGLISDLRDPVVKAMAATKEFDDLDEIEEEEDAERERQEAERKHREEIEKIENSGTQQ